MKKTYRVSYQAFNKEGHLIKQGVIKVKNCFSDFEAKVKLEAYLKKKHERFGRLVVERCVEDFLGSGFFDLFNDFKL